MAGYLLIRKYVRGAVDAVAEDFKGKQYLYMLSWTPFPR